MDLNVVHKDFILYNYSPRVSVTLAASAVKYTDCTSAEG